MDYFKFGQNIALTTVKTAATTGQAHLPGYPQWMKDMGTGMMHGPMGGVNIAASGGASLAGRTFNAGKGLFNKWTGRVPAPTVARPTMPFGAKPPVRPQNRATSVAGRGRASTLAEAPIRSDRLGGYPQIRDWGKYLQHRRGLEQTNLRHQIQAWKSNPPTHSGVQKIPELTKGTSRIKKYMPWIVTALSTARAGQQYSPMLFNKSENNATRNQSRVSPVQQDIPQFAAGTAEPLFEMGPVEQPAAEPLFEMGPVEQPAAEPLFEMGPVEQPAAEPPFEMGPVEQPPAY